MTHSEFELVPVTDTEQINATRLRNAVSWSGQLSADDYVVRETVLGKSQMIGHTSHDNHLQVFVLRDKHTQTAVASAELLVREAVRVDWSGKPVVRNLTSGAIGGVYTYEQFRGKGYAKIMLEKLVELSKEKYVGPEGFTFLYSEVGEYYTRFGFKSFPVDLIKIPIVETAKSVPVVPLVHDDFEGIFSQYEQQALQEVCAEVEKDHKSRVYLRPTSHIADWFYLRAKYISYKLHEEKQDLDFASLPYDEIVGIFRKTKPGTFGLAVEENGKRIASVIFTYDWSSKTEYYATVLKIVVANGHDKDELSKQLFGAMISFLHKNTELPGQKCTHIVVWESEVGNATKEFLVGLGGEHGIENSSRSAVLLHGERDQEDMLSGELVWAKNDKLSWF